jgi:hypothetical protein
MTHVLKPSRSQCDKTITSKKGLNGGLMVYFRSEGFYTGLLCLVLLTFAPGLVTLSTAGERFQPRGCEFSVEFPGKVKTYDVVIPSVGKVQNGEFRGGSGKASDSYIFIAEGMPVSRREILRYHKNVESYLLQSAQTYAEANGIEEPEFRHLKDKLGPGVVMRGYKTVEGVPVIYSSTTVLGERSIISIRIGCPSALFPPPGLAQVLKSIRRE